MIVIVNIPPATSMIITVNIDNMGSHLFCSYLLLATENIDIAVTPNIKDKREETSWIMPDIDILPELWVTKIPPRSISSGINPVIREKKDTKISKIHTEYADFS